MKCRLRDLVALVMIVLAAVGALSACQNAGQPADTASLAESAALHATPSPTRAITATLAPTHTNTPPAPPTLIVPSPPATRPALACQDEFELVLQHNYPAGPEGALPVLPPNSQLDQGWRVRNSGTCTWDSAYTLKPAQNSQGGITQDMPVALVGRVRPGETYDFWVHLSLPLLPGVYQSAWRLQNGKGNAFGEPLSFDFEIADLQTGTPYPEITLIASPLEMSRGEDVTIAWSARQAKKAYFYRAGQSWREHPVELNGSAILHPEDTTTYELRVVKWDDTVEIRRITIEILPFAPPKIRSFQFDPGDLIELGQCIDISWRITGRVNTVTILRDGVVYWTGLVESGSTWDCPTQTGVYRYVLQVVGPGGQVETQRLLEVYQP